MARECCSVLLAMGRKWLVIAVDLWRKVRDSNPRYPKRVYRISSPARSFTLPTFLKCVCKSNEFCWIRQTFVQKIRWSFPKISPWMLLPQLDVRAFCITFHTVTTFSAWYFHFPTYEHRITSLCLWWQHLFAMTPCRHFLPVDMGEVRTVHMKTAVILPEKSNKSYSDFFSWTDVTRALMLFAER